MKSEPRSAAIASGRSRPCVSEMTPIVIGSAGNRGEVPRSTARSDGEKSLVLHHPVHFRVRRRTVEAGVGSRALQFPGKRAEQPECRSHGARSEAHPRYSQLLEFRNRRESGSGEDINRTLHLV